MNDWITKEQLEQGRVQAEKIYKEFLQNDSQGEQSWDEIIIDGQYFDIECWDETGIERKNTTCAIYPVYPTNNGLRATEGTRWICLFTNKEKANE
jgi:hypothetical protein